MLIALQFIRWLTVFCAHGSVLELDRVLLLAHSSVSGLLLGAMGLNWKSGSRLGISGSVELDGGGWAIV